MEIHDIMTPEVYCLPPTATLGDAARLMRRCDIGAVPVCDGGSVLGIVTDRDLVVRGVAQGRHPEAVALAEVMTPHVVCCYDDEPVEDAADLMEDRQIRRLLVLDRQHRLVGIVSLADIAVDLQHGELSGEILERVSEPANSVR